MLHWTFKSLLAERYNVLGAAAGIALALLLALYLDAVFRGEAAQIAAFLEHSDADVFVLQKGVANLHMSSTRVTENAIAAVRGVDGVARLRRLVYRPALVGLRGSERLAYVVGAGADGDSAWDVAQGQRRPLAGQALLPEAMARQQGSKLGDRVRIKDREFAIGGLTRGTFSMANPLIYVTEADARSLFAESDGADAVLVWAAPGTSPVALARRIGKASDDVAALTRAELVASDTQLALDMGGALVGLMSMIGMLVAGLIVAFSAYAFVARRTRELAVIKALGATRGKLLTSAALQTGVIGVIGGVLAAAGIVVLDVVLERFVPEVAVQPGLGITVVLAGLTLVVAEVAALIPAWQLLNVDPAEVFNG
ncbi:MAG: ABC transporter permease [Sinimarinibacterium sp.]|jgi:putative ABC transport system permease protein